MLRGNILEEARVFSLPLRFGDRLYWDLSDRRHSRICNESRGYRLELESEGVQKCRNVEMNSKQINKLESKSTNMASGN